MHTNDGHQPWDIPAYYFKYSYNRRTHTTAVKRDAQLYNIVTVGPHIWPSSSQPVSAGHGWNFTGYHSSLAAVRLGPAQALVSSFLSRDRTGPVTTVPTGVRSALSRCSDS